MNERERDRAGSERVFGEDPVQRYNSGLPQEADVNLDSTEHYVFGSPEAEVVGALGASLKPMTPSAHVRENLLDSIVNLPQEPATRSDQAETKAEVTDLATRRRRWKQATINIAASVVLVTAGVGVGRWSAMDSMQSMEQVNHYAELNQAQDVERTMTTMDDGHKVTLTWSKSMDMAAVTFPAELRAPRGRSLQVWVEMNGKVSSGGMYAPGKDGSFSFVHLMPEPGDRVFVTVEPGEGSMAPTSPAIIEWTIGADGKANVPGNDSVRGL
ncbi:anti-sigma factor [Arcanobacterium ihumii]|uniref:anti-sigma factor n=1 Tax=Arcanobacterium ihumii TaxID=2138162 RepID=UPI000F54595E|nr:anti-sigma factor [Arcanobacterium ihumii]